MPNNPAGSNQRQQSNVSDQCLPEGAQINLLSTMVFDGTGTITYEFNTDNITYKKPTTIRSIYFDATGMSEDAVINVQGGPNIILPAGKQGYIPLFWPCPMQCSITSAAGDGNLTVYFYNFKVFPIIWSATGDE